MTEFQLTRSRRRAQSSVVLQSSEVHPPRHQKTEKRETTPVRGYDNPELFREDALIRIRELEREVAEDLKKREECD